MTSTPTLRELIAAATPGPWACNTAATGELDVFSEHPERKAHQVCSRSAWTHRAKESNANAQLIARCNPVTMQLVLEALGIGLKDAEGMVQIAKIFEDHAVVPEYEAKVAKFTSALQALNATGGKE